MSLRTSIPARPTPGEWFALREGIEVQSDAGLHKIGTEINGCLVILAQVETSGDFSVDGEDCDYALSDTEALANLHVLAASKKLLDALRVMAWHFEGNTISRRLPGVLEQAKQAIAEAEGRS